MTELGGKLKQAREEKGLSLDDLQSVTKIQKRYLIGIEEGNYSIMPGQFYARAFIKQYAEAVGLDPEEIFDEYKGDIPVNEKDEIPPLSRVKTRKKVTNNHSKLWNFLPRVLIFLAIIAVCVIIWVVFQKDGVNNDNANLQDQDKITEIDINPVTDSNTAEKNTDEEAEGANEEEESAEETPAAGTLTKAAQTGSESTFELTDTSKFDVELSSTGETWIDLYDGEGEKFYFDIVKKGQTETFDFSKEEEINIRIGRTYETDIKINGEVFEFPSEEITQTITIKFAPIGEQ